MLDLSDPAVVKEGCIRGLTWGLEHARSRIEIDDRGNLGDVEENFPPYMRYVCGSGELGSWMDHEIEDYMLSVRSSVALTVNCFGPLMMPCFLSASAATAIFMSTASSAAPATASRMPGSPTCR